MSEFSDMLKEMNGYGARMTDIAEVTNEKVATIRRLRDGVIKEPKYKLAVKVMAVHKLVHHMLTRQGFVRVPVEKEEDEV